MVAESGASQIFGPGLEAELSNDARVFEEVVRAGGGIYGSR